MMNTFTSDVFGTLPKQYCLYFFVLCILSFIIVVLALLSFLYLLTQKNVPSANYISAIAFFVNYCFIYLTYRLLYSMCISSLK